MSDHTNRQHDLERVLRDLHSTVDGVEGVVLATRDGLPVASTVPAERSERLAAMAASVFGLAQQAVHDPRDEAGASGHTVIRGRDGSVVVRSAGPVALLALQTGPKANMGMIQVAAPRVAGELAELLG